MTVNTHNYSCYIVVAMSGANNKVVEGYYECSTSSTSSVFSTKRPERLQKLSAFL